LQYQIERCTAPCVGLISKSDYLKDLDNMTLFLKGDNDVLTEKLALRMDQAAEKQEYERAAQFRDQLSMLKAVQSSQLVSRARGDFDVVAMEQSGSIACVAVMYFRGGRSLGSRNFFPRQAEGVAREEILRAFLLQYYGGREAPPEILLSQDVSDADQLGRMLSLRAGHRVRLKSRLRGDRRQWADLALTNARHAADLKRLSRATLARQFESLAQSLDLEAVPTRLECFDISHTSGEATVASCVVFGRGGPAKSDYRRYNITGITAGDDYAAMAQALQRRYSRSTLDSGTMPELIFVDGGRGQLAAAAGVMNDLGFAAVPLVGIAKGQGRRPGRETLYPSFGDRAVHLAPNSEALHLVQQIRDEAHRFALAGHRGRRQKRVVSSSLEQVRGLGPKRRQALLRHFGGLQAVRKAPVDDIARVRGISTQLAQSIYDAFHAD
jgi:excinuclease ABC subunit C